MTIDFDKLKNHMKDPNNKTKPARLLIDLIRELQMFILDLYSELKQFSVYHLSQWILSSDNWIKNHNNVNTRAYTRGQIVYVDFGHSNFGYELSFKHPCVVIYDGYNFMLVIPASTGRYNARSEFIFKCNNGFAKPSGLLLDKVGYISKSRVISSVVGTVDSKTMDFIDDFVFQKYCGSKKNEVQKTVNDLLKSIQAKDQEIKNLNERLEKAENQIIVLKTQDKTKQRKTAN